MSNFAGESSNGADFHTVHAERDPESNWSVDLHRLLEEYLAKICAGEILSEEDDHRIQVNFAEAALLLQGSVQVYSRKVEYLYSLVLHTLEFISQQRQQDQVGDATTDQPEETGPSVAPEENDDLFWGFDDVPVEAKNSLDTSGNNDPPTNHFVRPPANLVVLEGDCLDSSGDAGELELYLLAANDLFHDFILLDPCDAVAVDNFLKSNGFGKGQDGGEGPSSARKNFLSPRSRSGASKHRSSGGKNQKMNQSPLNNFDLGLDPDDTKNEFAFDTDNAYPGSDMGESDDDGDDDSNDPWKPLNPHDAGNLKVKPFKKVKASGKPAPKIQRISLIMDQFPLARRDSTCSQEFIDLWEKRRATREKQQDANPPALYEQLRQSLINGGNEAGNAFGNTEDVADDNGYADVFHDFGEAEPDIPENVDMDVDAQHHEKPDGDAAQFDVNDACGIEDPLSNGSLEDLCRSHLDALLASIAENEKQTELAARVSTWKQNIERNLEEQESHPPFDIHEYGERILTKFSVEADCGDPMSFADIVSGSEMHDVARSFSALLQLVNNGDVDLDKGKDVNAQCYTAVNPFYVRLGRNKKQGRVQVRSSKKRVTSPIRRVSKKGEVSKKTRTEDSPESSSSQSKTRSGNLSNGKIALKNGKVGGIRCTPDRKRRRKSRYVDAAVEPSRSNASALG